MLTEKGQCLNDNDGCSKKPNLQEELRRKEYAEDEAVYEAYWTQEHDVELRWYSAMPALLLDSTLDDGNDETAQIEMLRHHQGSQLTFCVNREDRDDLRTDRD